MSDRRLRLAIAALSALGAAVATYLTVLKLTDATPVCGTGGCAIVEHSKYSELLGIPTAAFGIALWTALIATTLSARESLRTAGAAIALAGAAVAIYLVYLQLAVIDAVCVWCTANDGLTFVVAALAAARAGTFGAAAPASSGRPART